MFVFSASGSHQEEQPANRCTANIDDKTHLSKKVRVFLSQKDERGYGRD